MEKEARKFLNPQGEKLVEILQASDEEIAEMPRKVNREEHKDRHQELHRALDELFADYIAHHPDETQFTQMPVIKLIQWSNEQQHNPTELP